MKTLTVQRVLATSGDVARVGTHAALLGYPPR